jgi:hypothetical protein
MPAISTPKAASCAAANNQSEELVLDADHLVILNKSQLEPMFAHRSPVATGRIQPHPAMDRGKPKVEISPGGAAAAFAQKWLSAATSTEIANLLAERPVIPQPIDIELLTSVERALNRSLRDDDQSREHFPRTPTAARRG